MIPTPLLFEQTFLNQDRNDSAPIHLEVDTEFFDGLTVVCIKIAKRQPLLIFRGQRLHVSWKLKDFVCFLETVPDIERYFELNPAPIDKAPHALPP